MEMLFSLFCAIQLVLFPHLESRVGKLSDRDQEFVRVVELARIDDHLGRYRWTGIGRKPKDRKAIALAFIAKSVYKYSDTRMLIENLKSNNTLRQLCGWVEPEDVPSESCFSRAFAQFSAGKLPELVHEAMVRACFKDQIVEHISRDSTAINAREKRAKAPADLPENAADAEPGRTEGQELSLEPTADKATRDGRRASAPLPTQPIDVLLADVRERIQQSAAGHQVDGCGGKSKGKKRGGTAKKRKKPSAKEPKRLDLQGERSLVENLADLPRLCDSGGKRNSKGHTSYWIGYKLHIDSADGDIPISAVLTSASVHDSQVAIPLTQMTNDRVAYLYEVSDSAYDAQKIKEFSTSTGHVPITDSNKRTGDSVPMDPAHQVRYRARSGSERVNSNLLDNLGGRNVRVRGPEKVMTHLMFGIVALTAMQLFKLVV